MSLKLVLECVIDIRFIGSGNGATLTRRQVIIWTNDDLIHWHITWDTNASKNARAFTARLCGISDWAHNSCRWIVAKPWSHISYMIHCGLDKMADIFKKTFSDGFFEWKSLHFNFTLSLIQICYQGVNWKWNRHWVMGWLWTKQPTCNYLDQWWLWCQCGVTRPQRVKSDTKIWI